MPLPAQYNADRFLHSRAPISEGLDAARPKLAHVVASIYVPSRTSILEGIQSMRNNLATQSELLKIVLTETRLKLSSEIETYLSALRKASDNPSPVSRDHQQYPCLLCTRHICHHRVGTATSTT